jgi:NTE family protein
MTTRALVLSGGGPVGIAWECGLIGGMAEAGVDLSTADFILGTSAGSFVGAQLAMGMTPQALAAPFLAMGAEKPLPRPVGSAGGPSAPPPDLTQLARMMAEAASGERPAQDVRAEIGAWALAAPTMDEDAFLYSFGRFLNELAPDAWPQRGYACSAVDAVDGSFRLWTKDSGVGLARAVASSCSVPGVYPPVTIDGRRYIDGGMRSGTNADMAKGYDLVVVVAIPAGGAASPAAERARKTLDGELQVLRKSGARVALIAPDEASMQALGVNLMDARRRPGAAVAGYAQGQTGADAQALRAAWAG